MRLNLDVLLILDALDKHGSFATAAESLFKTPAALSYMIQKLENDLNITAGSLRAPGEIYRYRQNDAGERPIAAECRQRSGKAGGSSAPVGNGIWQSPWMTLSRLARCCR
jgi:hypothetical protein